jgi:hypothetical protein
MYRRFRRSYNFVRLGSLWKIIATTAHREYPLSPPPIFLTALGSRNGGHLRGQFHVKLRQKHDLILIAARGMHDQTQGVPLSFRGAQLGRAPARSRNPIAGSRREMRS